MLVDFVSLECEKSELKAAAASAKRGQILKLAQQNIFTPLLCLFCCLQKYCTFRGKFNFCNYVWIIILYLPINQTHGQHT